MYFQFVPVYAHPKVHVCVCVCLNNLQVSLSRYLPREKYSSFWFVYVIMTGLLLNCCMVHGLHINTHTYTHILYTTPFMVHACIPSALICTQFTTHYDGECTSTLSHTICTQQHAYLLDIPWQPTCMKLGTGGLYQPTCCKQGSYMSFAQGYPTNLLQYPDRTAFAMTAFAITARAHAVLPGYCNIIIRTYTYCCTGGYIHTHTHMQTHHPIHAEVGLVSVDVVLQC